MEGFIVAIVFDKDDFEFKREFRDKISKENSNIEFYLKPSMFNLLLILTLTFEGTVLLVDIIELLLVMKKDYPDAFVYIKVKEKSSGDSIDLVLNDPFVLDQLLKFVDKTNNKQELLIPV